MSCGGGRKSKKVGPVSRDSGIRLCLIENLPRIVSFTLQETSPISSASHFFDSFCKLLRAFFVSAVGFSAINKFQESAEEDS